MELKFGIAVSSRSNDPKDLTEKLNKFLEFADEAIELSLTRPSKFSHEFNDEIISLLKKFKYRSIHAPVRDSNFNPIKYPSDEGGNELKKIAGLSTADFDIPDEPVFLLCDTFPLRWKDQIPGC